MRTCETCGYNNQRDCRGHAPTVTESGTYWPQVEITDLACFNYKAVAEESTKPDEEQLYNYIRIGKRRTIKQIEAYFNWTQDELEHNLNLLKAAGYITNKQQGIAYWWIATDTDKKYVGRTFNVKEWLLNTLTENKPVSMTELIARFKEDTGQGITTDFIPALKQLKEDKFIVITKGTYEGKECQFFRLNS